jgi:IS5 family transposase
MPWTVLYEAIAPHYPMVDGRRPVGMDRMLRIHVIQHWFNLACELVPDATTMLKFHHLLHHNQLTTSWAKYC